ncbi:ubiquinol-cytochrome c reductase iron-sulfur subunit N-terminal domain-containing protein [Devosia sp.]
MKRRDFFKSATAATAGAAAAGLAAPAIAQGNITWRMVTTWPG